MQAILRATLSSVLAVFCLAMISAPGKGDTFSLECAARDLKLFTTIEEVGSAGTVNPTTVYDAYLALLNARHACRIGQVADALQMYGNISLGSLEASAK